MASSAPLRANLSVQHNFEGDADILDATIERRTEVRKALTGLAQDLQRAAHGNAVQIQAEIKLQVGGHVAKEHVYTISVTDHGFNAVEFARAVPQSGTSLPRAASAGVAISPGTGPRPNGQQSATARRESHRADLDDDLLEIRPFKRQKANLERSTAPTFHSRAPSSSAQPSQPSAPTTPPDDAMAFLKNWHDEWTRQGGWLFDTLSKTQTTANGIRGSLEKKLESVQDTLGQSINASSASTMNELGSITKLIHWLEHCCKTSADKLQAREEKWRSSSATFHDTGRREREAAEKRIEKKLDEQNELLAKLARVNGIDEGPGQSTGGSEQRSREASLGAQLTAELNNEAGHARGSENDPFGVDD